MRKGSDVPEDLLLQRASRDDAVHVDDLLLTDTMGAIHGLHIFLRIPIMLHEDDGIGTSQIKTQTTNACCEEEHIVARVAVESVDDVLTLVVVELGLPGGASSSSKTIVPRCMSQSIFLKVTPE